MDTDSDWGWGRPGFPMWLIMMTILVLLSLLAYVWLPAGARIPRQISLDGEYINFEA